MLTQQLLEYGHKTCKGSTSGQKKPEMSEFCNITSDAQELAYITVNLVILE